MSTFPPIPARRSLKRIAFFGDAFTTGAGDETGLGWVGRLVAGAFAGNHDVTAYNLGIRAASTRLIGPRWRDEAEARLPASADGRLVFMFGGNDAKQLVGGDVEVPLDESAANARTMLSDAKAWLPTLWIGMVPMNEARPYPRLMAGPQYAFSNARQATYNARYKAVAEEIGVPFLDLHTILQDDPDWPRLTQAGDGSNPAAEGYAKIAGIIAAWPAWRAWFA